MSETWSLNVDGNAAKRLEEITKAAVELSSGIQKQSKDMSRLRSAVDDTTDRLKFFGERGEKLAGILEEISDPLERIRLGQKLLERETKRLGTAQGRLEVAFKSAKARIAAMPPAYKAVAAAAVTTGLAVGALALKVATMGADAWVKYAEKGGRAGDSLKAFKAQAEETEVGVGRLIERTTAMSDVLLGLSEMTRQGIDNLEGLAGATDALTDAFWKSSIGTEAALKAYRAFAAVARKAKAEQDAWTLSMESYSSETIEHAKRLSRMRGSLVEVKTAASDLATEFRNARVELLALANEDALAAFRGSIKTSLDPSRFNGGGGGGGGRRRQVQSADKDGTFSNAFATMQDEAQKEADFWEGVRAKEKAALYAADDEKLAEEDRYLAELEKRKDAEIEMRSRQLEILQGISTDIRKMDEEAARPMKDAMIALASAGIQAAAALATVFASIASGSVSASDAMKAWMGSLGSMFQQIGTGLLISGLGLEALFKGNPAGAIGFGAGLVVVGAAMQGLAGSGAPTGGGGRSSSGGGTDAAVRSLFREFDARDQAETDKQPIVVQIGTRKIFDTIADGQRRGLLLGSNA